MLEHSCDESSEGPVWKSEYGGGRPLYVAANETGEPGFEVAMLFTDFLL